MTSGSDKAAWLDLTGEALSNQLLDQALIAAQRARLQSELAPLLAAADPASRALGEALLDQLARVMAEVTELRQAEAAGRRGRGAQLRVDPLPFIPAERAPSAPTAADHFDLAMDSAGFNGLGWYAAEHDGQSAYRWSGAAQPASLMLPSLGGGRLRLAALLRLPFQAELAPEAIRFRINEMEVTPRVVKRTPRAFHLEFDLELPEEDPLGRFALVMEAPSFPDTRPIPKPDRRLLGPGLWKLSLTRQA